MKPFQLGFANGVLNRAFVVALALTTFACQQVTESPRAPAAAGEWREFSGTLNAVGSRHTIPLGDGRKGSMVDLRGTMLLHGEGRPGIGFRAEIIALVDSTTGLVGRSVWTDEHGDQVFSEIAGQGAADGSRIAGTILGGTGRYDGIFGTYAFSWQSVIATEDGPIQGRATDLEGRVRIGLTGPGTSRP